ncbi:hypothetical protein [Desulfosporosinus meridiei]|uniref:Uncharacterized protein n=1 Tax=Desulfosporosinus meridiei (strain ATCC BAA-275 / DSM 13257 / KCTC 12902 / NCIMB 13706 / S10) TaxID=768704 RepID=J7IYC9_DESMD|nr:hypothetical protein [Desulfosporosinus meridiei]AFQ45149.1 hypothetical protein Desmer_3272 [Desulfosporosinus meridiei DSM 13257]
MPYPEQIDQLSPKFNRKPDGSAYAVEEELPIFEGVYSGLLGHDNITNSTIRVYTESRFAGEEITNFIVSIPSESPWKRMIKIFASVGKVYVTYETLGDMVEAEDINLLQESLIATQQALESYKKKGIVDGGTFLEEV